MARTLAPNDHLVPATYTLRPDQVARVISLAEQEGLSCSCFIRRLLDKSRGFKEK